MSEQPASAALSPAASGQAASVTRDPILSARGISKSFKVGERRLTVLHGVDLDVARGELTCLMGASGAGKSTLIQILGLLDAPDAPPAGSRPGAPPVRLDGVDAWGLMPPRRARLRNTRIGFVFQFYHLLPELDAVENVLLPARIGAADSRFGARRRELRQRAEQLLADFGLAERLAHRPAQLSGGERQRVAIARALFLDPPLLIADEPTGNLDSATGARVLDLLLQERERRGLSLILVTHDERVAARCQRIVRMADGRIVADGAPPRG